MNLPIIGAAVALFALPAVPASADFIASGHFETRSPSSPAGAQQAGCYGASTEWRTVSFGGSDGISNVLSFMAGGTANGVPPFALPDRVTLNATPEPASVSLMLGVILVSIGTGVARRKKKNNTPPSE
jgi:hypothetical protein